MTERTADPVLPHSRRIDDFFGVNAQAIGTVGMLLNFAVMAVVSLHTPPPPRHVQDMVEAIRYPRVRDGATA